LNLDPLSPVINHSLAAGFYFNHQYDLALEQCRKTLELDPTFARTYRLIGRVYLQKSMFEKAIENLEKAEALSGNSLGYVSMLAYGNAISGNRLEALQVMEQLKNLSKQKYVPPSYLALIYCGLGEKDQAFEWLEKAFDSRDVFLVNWLNSDPGWDPIRADPRYMELLRRMRPRQ
jgi:tetratricopeptide (TPR) repeat protein